MTIRQGRAPAWGRPFVLPARAAARGFPARFPAGWLPAAWLLWALLLPPATARAASFPAAATGDLWFQADHAGFRSADGSIVEEYYLRLPNNQVEFETVRTDSGDFLEGRIFVRLEFQDDDGHKIGTASERFEFRAGSREQAETADRVQLFLMREPLHPRTGRVRISVEDLNARKRGLIYLITKKRKNGTLEAFLRPPPPDSAGLGLSDVQFAWSYRPGGESGLFHKSGWSVVPNPARTFGLYQDTLRVYYEIYDRQPEGYGAYIVEESILDDRGAILMARVDTVTIQSGRGPRLSWLPLGELPAGTFDFQVRLDELGSRRTIAAIRPFNVVWSEGSWARPEEEILAEARILLEESDYERFKEMPFGDRESFLAAFWASHDPSPNDARNELKDVFLARVAFANQNYGSPLEPGLSTDRGRVFIRYGLPDETTREDMPRPGNTLSDVLDGVDMGVDDGVSDQTDVSRRDGLQSANFQDVDTRPYEIWRYTRTGDPLFPERERITSNTGFYFIFVDDQGIGTYTLRYASGGRRY